MKQHPGRETGRVGGPRRGERNGVVMVKVKPTKRHCKHGHRLLFADGRVDEGNTYWKKRQPWHTVRPAWYAECRTCRLARDRRRSAAAE